MGETSSSKFSQNLLYLSHQTLYTKSMKNKNKYPINGSIIEDISVRTGVHQYDEKNRTVVELTFQGYNCSYVQVIDLATAASLVKQLKTLGVVGTERITADEAWGPDHGLAKWS